MKVTVVTGARYNGVTWWGTLDNKKIALGARSLVWMCNHNDHPDEIAAEFCALDFLLEDTITELEPADLEEDWESEYDDYFEDFEDD